MLLTIDFETYFDSECTLKKLNYIQYLNHPKFEVIGAAILHGNRHEFLTHDELVDFLDDLDPAETSVLAHNTLFDGCILAWRYNFHPRKWLDTLSMAKGKLASPSHSLDAVAQHFGLPRKKSATFKGKTWNELTREEQRNLEDYARHDVWLCREIYDRLMPYPQSELDLIDLTIRMFVEPTLELDLALADELLLEQRANKKTLREATGLTSTQLSSNKQLAELIKERYNLDPPTKISPTTGEETWALSKTDPEFETFYAGAPPGLQSLLDARIAIKSTIEETRLETLIETQKFVGKIPVPLIYYGGHTGRWSGSIYNLQNLPKKSRIRNTLIAPKGHVLLIADSASIEARVLAWFAEQEDLIQIFRDKGDPYKHMASRIYGTPTEEITKTQRSVGKQAVLGCGYGMGATKFRATANKQGVKLTVEEAEQIVQIYRKTNNKIKALWGYLNDRLHDIAHGIPDNPFFAIHDEHKCVSFEKNAIRLPNGLALKYPKLDTADDGNWFYGGNRKVYGGAMTENVIQALARIVIGEQALRAHREVAPVVLLVHDEIVCVTPKQQAENKLNQLLEIMRTPPTWAPDLPLDAEGEASAFYKK